MSSATDTVNTSDVKPLINDFDEETQEGKRNQNIRTVFLRIRPAHLEILGFPMGSAHYTLIFLRGLKLQSNLYITAL